MEYNNFNQLTQVGVDGLAATYEYNAQGIRTTRIVGKTQTRSLLDGGNVVAEQTGTATTNYLRGVNLINKTVNSATEYYSFNAHGDVVNLTNSTGTITKTYDYDAFGNERNPDETDPNPFRYCGEYWDPETGTYYLRARYYAPPSEGLQRKIPPDPVLTGTLIVRAIRSGTLTHWVWLK